MLVKQLAAQYDGKVVVIDQNYGESELAKRYGVKYYPAVFFQDALVARPEDFYPFDMKTEDGKPRQGRYMPWKDAKSRALFKADMKRMLELALADEALPETMYRKQQALSFPVAKMPDFEIQDLDGKTIKSSDFKGKTTIVMMWATWCPPCKTTMAWFSEKPPKNTSMLAIAVGSEVAAVRRSKAHFKATFPIAMGNDNIVETFGGITSVPTIFVFAPDGQTVRIIYGAEENLEEKLTTLINQINTK